MSPVSCRAAERNLQAAVRTGPEVGPFEMRCCAGWAAGDRRPV